MSPTKSCNPAVRVRSARLRTRHRSAAGRSSTSTTSCRPTPAPTSTSSWAPAATRSAVSPTDTQKEFHMRRAIITGGQSGLGAACADRLRADGIDVITFDIAREADYQVDVTDAASIDAAVDAVGR